MDSMFDLANHIGRQRAHQQWHRWQSKRQILRSQVGFVSTSSLRPRACRGCSNYHGLRYGLSGNRVALTCAMHPFGWHQDGACPDWQAIVSQPKADSND